MKKTYIYCTLAVLLVYGSCTDNFLNTKPNTNLVLPQTLADISGLLDNTLNIVYTGGLGHLGADEYEFVSYAAWQSTFTATERNAHIWASDIYEGAATVPDWNQPYQAIFYANNALQSLNDLNLLPSPEQDNVRGWALFIRAYTYHDLLKNFCMAYDGQTASSDLGLPLRLSPAIDEIKPRASLADTYFQVIRDLKQAAALLTPVFQQANRNRPSKTTAYAMLARVYLSMNQFTEAGLHVDSALNLYNKLIDYNTVPTNTDIPFTMTNDETLYSSRQLTAHNISRNSPSNTAVTVNPSIMDLYREGDLRRSVFFGINAQGNYYVKTGYFGSAVFPFHGVAVDEVYLIKAECLARTGNTEGALLWLNSLLVNRFTNATPYEPLTAVTPEEALTLVLTERCKELIWRGLRWGDIKRLNKIGANITLRRELNGQEYTLPPNDPRYAFPIPDDELTRSKITQNPR